MYKSGFVSIVGKPNAGKSTLINALLGQKLAIVTPKAQTTRHKIYGILNEENYQIILVDTPGIIVPKYKLQTNMMKFVASAMQDSEVIVLVADVQEKFDETEVIEKLKTSKMPIILALNKIDVSDPDEINERIEHFESLLPIKATIPMSALHKENIEMLLNKVLEFLPEGPAWFEKDQLTDKPEKFFVSEFIREQIFLHCEEELPYSSEVSILVFDESKKPLYIDAEIHLEKKSHKGMIIGKEGQMIKKIGTEARKSIEKFLGKKVFLNLYVRVTENWKESDFHLKNFGYEEPKE